MSLSLRPEKYISFSKARMLSPTGRCRTFDAAADGYVPGEGVAVLLLQPLEQAPGLRPPGSTASWRAPPSTTGGRARSLTVPRREAQREVLEEAYREAGFGPESVSFVETHGTGTPLGDVVELEALGEVFKAAVETASTPPGSCTLGAVKTQIGHLEACSGLAGVIKVLLMMKHRKIPGNLHLERVNPSLPLEGSPFRPGPRGDALGKPRGLRGAPSGGELLWHRRHQRSRLARFFYLQEPESPSFGITGPQVFLLAGRSPESLEELRGRFLELLEGQPEDTLPLRDLCATLALGRATTLPHRLGFVVRSLEELRQRLKSAKPGFPGRPASPRRPLPWRIRKASREPSRAGFRESR